MLSGIKLIPREELLEEDCQSADCLRMKRRKNKHHNSSSYEEEGSKMDERHTLKSKKKVIGTWSSSNTSSSSPQSESNSDSDMEHKCFKNRKKMNFQHEKDSRRIKGKVSRRQSQTSNSNEKEGSGILRKEMGLEWMLQPRNSLRSNPGPVEYVQEPQVEEGKEMNSKELNPYLRDNGNGYPNDASDPSVSSHHLLSSSLVGDGGASWKLKALKRAKERAAREGRTLQEVVGERSLQMLASSVAGHRSAPFHAHLHAIKERKKGQTNIVGNQDKMFSNNDSLKDVSSNHPDMKQPKQDNLKWTSKHLKRTPSEDNSLISEALSSINKFSNDGSFMDSIFNQQNKDAYAHCHGSPGQEAKPSLDKDLASENRDCRGVLSADRQVLSSNQVAAKVLRLKMIGKHEEAEKLSKRMDILEKNSKETRQHEIGGSTNRYTKIQLSSERMKCEDDADKHLAQKIMQSRSYSISQSADDEYEFYDEDLNRKHSKNKDFSCEDKTDFTRRILTQKERCQFCFENPSRPKHLVISIGNATYLMLPTWEPVIQGHCCILPLQHELATRSVDRNVWEELRNFKKCLLKMYSNQGKGVIFIETVIGLSRQRRHCLIECIPLPSHVAEEAPPYFKKAIDDAEGEWGQHDMKKVIPTSGNLRNVIPDNFSYFHVEFGLDKGFVHVIDDDSNFSSSFGSNVVRGMLRLPEETMRHHQRREAADKQKQAVTAFVQDWEPFDWTREL